jgi:acyl-CoA synthetase (NDP forming)
VDLGAQATTLHYEKAARLLLDSSEIDCLIAIHVPVVDATHLGLRAALSAAVAARAGAAKEKPVLVCLMAEEGEARALHVAGETVPAYGMPEDAAHALAKAAAYAEWRGRPAGVYQDLEKIDGAAGRAVCHRVLATRGSGWLTSEETRELLAAFSLPLPPGGVARTPDEAVAVAERIGFPVAVKLSSTRILHKTEAGGVQLGLADAAAVRAAFERIRRAVASTGREADMEGVTVQPMLTGVEVMAGVTQDPLFGPLVAFGLGGIHVEVLGDVGFRVSPLTDRDAADLVREIKGRRLLEGYRGHPPADIDALEDLLLRVSRMVEEVPEVVELDLNPIMVLPPGRGCRIADARVRVEQARSGGGSAR